jgi:hypothetical protein
VELLKKPAFAACIKPFAWRQFFRPEHSKNISLQILLSPEAAVQPGYSE